LLPIAKVEERGARIFEASPIDYTLLARKYIGYFAAFMRRRAGNLFHHGIGLDKETVWEWYYQNTKECVADIDYSKFDATTPPVAARLTQRIIHYFYGDYAGEEWSEEAYIRASLLEEVTHSTLFVRDQILQKSRGVTSGHQTTDLFNCFLNIVSVMHGCLTAYQSVERSLPTHEEFSRKTFFIAYGDDLLFSVAREYAQKIPLDVLVAELKRLGLRPTRADKSQLTGAYSTRGEASFLKSMFVQRDNVVWPVMPLEVEYKILNYVKKKNLHAQALLEARAQDAARIAAYRGRSAHALRGSQITEAFSKIGASVRLDSYELIRLGIWAKQQQREHTAGFLDVNFDNRAHARDFALNDMLRETDCSY
jgi:hypothetical protein